MASIAHLPSPIGDTAKRPTFLVGAPVNLGMSTTKLELDQRDHRADVLEADPAALAPPDPHRPAGPGASIITQP